MTGVFIETTGADRVEAHFLGMATRAEHMSPVLHQIARGLRLDVAERFATEGHGEWAPLTEETRASKAAAGYPPDILQATRELFRSLTEEHGDHIEVITDDTLIFGTSDPKAKFHQAGTSRMPQRVILEAPQIGRGQESQRDITRQVQGYLVASEGGLGQDVPVWLK